MDAFDVTVAVVAADQLGRAVARAVAQLQSDDPFAPVRVLAPGSVSARSLRREVASAGGAANVHVLTLEKLARDILADAGVHVGVVMGKDVRRELTRLVAADARPPLVRATGAPPSPALVQSLVQAFDDLRVRSVAELEHLAASSALAAEVVRLFVQFRRRAQDAYVDRRDIIEGAATVVDDRCPPVVFVMAHPPEAYEAELLHALFAQGRLRTIALKVGDDRVDDAARTWLWGLGPTAEEPVAVPAPDRFTVAPDARTEVGVAVAALLEHAVTGVPFSRMAVVFPQTVPYAALVTRALDDAGIPWTGTYPWALDATVGGRFLLGLVRVLESRLDIDAVGDWLADAPLVVPSQGGRVPAARWMDVVRRARARGGMQWSARLRSYAESCAGSVDRADDARVAQQVAAFMDDLVAWASPRRSTWSDWAAWLQSAIDRYLGPHAARASWPQHAQEAMLSVEASIGRIARLDAIGGPVDLPVVSAVLREELSGVQDSRQARDGVLVGTLGDAIGSRFDVVVACGMAEGSIPMREASSGLAHALRVPGEERRTERDRRAFLAMVGAAGWCSLSFARADHRRGKEARPSPWLLEMASERAGRVVTVEELLEGRASWPWLRVVPSYSAFVRGGTPPHDDVHGELSVLARSVRGGSHPEELRMPERLAKGFSVVAARDGASLDRFSGGVGPMPVLAARSAGALRPTALERWSTCPFQYFLADVLGLADRDHDDDPFATSPREKGSMVHSVLERFLRTVPPRTSPSDDWTDGERVVLHEIADEVLDLAFRSGRSPSGLLAELERAEVHEHLDAFLAADRALREAYGTVPHAVELAFGGAAAPVVLDVAEGRPVHFRGRIDRVDLAPDGRRAVVIDYKTGRASAASSLAPDPVAAGTKLQLAVYAEAVRHLLPQVEQVDALYWHVADGRSGYRRIGIEVDDGVRARLHEVVDGITSGIAQGTFPAVPGAEERPAQFANCRRCSFDAVCAADRDEAWTRVAADDRVAAYVRLADRPAPGDRSGGER